MNDHDDLTAEAAPVRAGWSVRVRLHGDAVAEGVVRVHHGLTWMQQRRAIEERLRSWGFAVPPEVVWNRRADGGIRLDLTALAEGSAVSAA